MIGAIQAFFDRHILGAAQADKADEQALHLATATLLFEMAQMDDHVDERERAAMQALLADRFSLDEQLTAELVELAADNVREAVCMQEFTRLINESFSQQQKRQMVKMLWQVAMSDGVIDKYEDLFVRRVADLLYVPHSAFIMAKHEAEKM